MNKIMNKRRAILLVMIMLFILNLSHAYNSNVYSEEYVPGNINATRELYFDYVMEWDNTECNNDGDYKLYVYLPFRNNIFMNTSYIDIHYYVYDSWERYGPYEPDSISWQNDSYVIFYFLTLCDDYGLKCHFEIHINFTANASAPKQNESLEWIWENLQYYFRFWRDCGNFETLTTTTYIIAPYIRMHTNVVEDPYLYRSVEWALGLRNPPFIYVEDVIGLKEKIDNIKDVNHGSSAYDLNFTIKTIGNVLLNESYYEERKDELLTSHSWIPVHTFKALEPGVQTINASVIANGSYYTEDIYTFYILDPNITVESPGLVDYNSLLSIKFNVSNNATNIKDIYAVFYYYDVNSSGLAYDNITLNNNATNFNYTNYTMVITNDYAYTLNEFELYYVPKHSGKYRLIITVLFENASLQRSNTTDFEVKQGSMTLISSFPTYRILANQSGNITFCFEVLDGDIYNLSLFFNTSSSAINVIKPYHYFYKNYTNGTKLCENWFVNISAQPSIVYGNLSYKISDNSWKQIADKYFEVAFPKIDFSHNPLSLSDLDKFYTEVKVVGNLTPLDFLAYMNYTQTLFEYNNEVETDNLLISTENECYINEQQEGNELSANSTIIDAKNVDFANYSLDLDYITYATFREYVENSANITIRLPDSYLLYKVAVYGKAASSTERLRIYYYDISSNNYIETDETKNDNIYLPTTMDFTNVTFISAFKTDKLKIEIKGSDISYISEIKIYVAQIDSDDPCYIYNFTYINLNTSGKVNVSVLVSTQTNNISSYSSFNILFGIPRIFLCNDYDSETGNLYLSNITKPLKYIHIYPDGGDLYNITLNLTINDSTLINFATGESPIKNIPYLSYINYTSSISSSDRVCKEAGFLITYNLTSFIVLNTTNTSINITAYDYLSNIMTYNDTGIIDLRPEDTEPPKLQWYYIGYLGENYSFINYSLTNAFTTLDLYFKAEDNLRVTSAIIELTYPDNNKTNYTSNIMLYNGTWSNGIFIAQVDGSLINVTGNYNIKLYILDYVNLNATNNQTGENLTVGDKLKVIIEPLASLYNRGQQFVIRALLLNGKYLGSLMNVTMNLTRNNNITEMILCESGNFINKSTFLTMYCDGTSLTTTIPLNETPSHYNASIFLQYFISVGNATISFDTSDKLNISAYSLTTTNDGITYVKFIRAKISHQNGYNDIINPYLFDVNTVKCNDETTLFTNYDDNTKEFYTPVLSSCKLPATITAYVVYNNNTGYLSYTESLPSSSIPPSSSGSSSGGGGGGGSSGGSSGGGFSYVPLTYNYTSPIINLTYMDIVVIAKNMDYITQSSNQFFYIEYSNKRDERLEVNTEIVTNCENCNITPYKEYFILMPLQTLTKEYKLYIPLYQQPANYNISIHITNNKKEEFYKVIPFVVRKNSKVVIFEKAKENLRALKEEVDFFSSLGINMEKEYDIIDEIEQLFMLANQSIYKDNLTALILYLERSQVLTKDIINGLARKEWLKFYYLHKREIWAYGAYALFALTIMFTYVLPLLSMITRLRYLRRKEKLIIETRKETEKEYFIRKIDEITFRRIMEQEQDKLIKIRKEIEKLEREIELMTSFKFIELWKFRKELEEREKKIEELKKLEEKKKRSLREILSSLKPKSKLKLKDIEKDEIKYEVIKPKVVPVKIDKKSRSITETRHHNEKDKLDDVMSKIRKLIDEEEVDRT